jgi:uncharacterized protein YbjT (DUF2867 family)
MILVTGVSGTVGRAVLDEVRKTSQPVRALYRAPTDAKKAPLGVNTVLGDFASKESLRGALAGVHSVFLVCSPIPALVELESNVIDACKEAGAKYVLLNSALGAADWPKSFPSWHRKVEDKLKTSGLNYAIFRPNSFLQNILSYMAPSIRAQGAFYSSMGKAPTSFLDVRDIALAAAKCLAAPADHAGKTYELNGPEAVSYDDLAARISRIAGRPVKYIDIPESAQRKSMLDLGMPEWQVTALIELQQYYVSGKGGEVTDVLVSLIGPPKMLDAFLDENKNEFRSEPPRA